MTIYNIHFVEDLAPSYNDILTYDAYIEGNENLDIDAILNEVEEIKDKMNSHEEEPIYSKYNDYGWDEKIYEAINLIKDKYGFKVLNVKRIETYIV